MQRELLWFLDNDMLARGIPPNHVVVLGTLEQAANGHVVSDYTRRAQREREREERGGRLRYLLTRAVAACASGETARSLWPPALLLERGHHI